MREGMLWFDNYKKRSTRERIIRAANYYEQRFNIKPTLCFVHPTMVLDGSLGDTEYNTPYHLDDIEVRTTNSVLPNHFWIGAKNET